MEALNDQVEKEASVKGKGKVAKVVKKEGPYECSVETTGEELVQCVKDEREIIFYAEDLPDIDSNVMLELPYKVVKAYEDAKKEKGKDESKIEVLGMLGNNARNRLRLRARKGWHQTWKRPDELDEALDSGYVVVRKAKGKEVPGKETGEIRKIGGPEKTELIAMELSQERYDNHQRAVRERSVRAYKANKESFAESVEQFNASIPNSADRLLVRDDEGDVN